jgi:NADPH:quinone reductase-like Zn-dependent oxidoreductase
MKTYELTGSFGIDNLKLAERDQPTPGPGQILVKLHAWSLNYRDLLVVRGHYYPKLSFPALTLSDGAGQVVAVGAGVTRLSQGQRVAGIFMQTWLEGEPSQDKSRSALGAEIPGLSSDYAVLDADGAVLIPDHLSYEEAATLPCAAVTAWQAIVTKGNVKASDTLLIQGTGGVSIFALQFAKMHGARVIATSSSDEKLARVKAMGADHVINYKTAPDWGREARDLTGGRGVDHVIEVGGAGTLPQSIAAVRSGGRISVIGVLSGLAGDGVNPMPVLINSLVLQGIFVGSRTMFEDMNRAIALHQMRPVIDRVFPFADYPAALRHLESGAHFGKVVLKA